MKPCDQSLVVVIDVDSDEQRSITHICVRDAGHAASHECCCTKRW